MAFIATFSHLNSTCLYYWIASATITVKWRNRGWPEIIYCQRTRFHRCIVITYSTTFKSWLSVLLHFICHHCCGNWGCANRPLHRCSPFLWQHVKKLFKWWFWCKALSKAGGIIYKRAIEMKTWDINCLKTVLRFLRTWCKEKPVLKSVSKTVENLIRINQNY